MTLTAIPHGAKPWKGRRKRRLTCAEPQNQRGRNQRRYLVCPPCVLVLKNLESQLVLTQHDESVRSCLHHFLTLVVHLCRHINHGLKQRSFNSCLSLSIV